MDFAVLTVFPQIFENLRAGLTQTAEARGIYSLEVCHLRDFGKGVHKAIDDEPYGGGDGMLMQCEPLHQALSQLKASSPKWQKARVVHLSPKGQVWTQAKAQDWVKENKPCVFICGRYAGVDQRFIDLYCDEEISIGDYILNGGELGALVIMESMVRLLEGTLGNPDSSIKDSFSETPLLEHPQYTRPQTWQGKEVPETLLSGHHHNIEIWKNNMSILETAWRRPELLRKEDHIRLQKILISTQELDLKSLSDFGLDKVAKIKQNLQEKPQ